MTLASQPGGHASAESLPVLTAAWIASRGFAASRTTAKDGLNRERPAGD